MTTYRVYESVLVMALMLNIAVSVAVAMSGGYSARQKIFQIAVIWLLPVLGAVLLGLFMLSQIGNGTRAGRRSVIEDDSQVWSELLHKDHSPRD